MCHPLQEMGHGIMGGGGVLSNCNLLYVNIGELESTVKQTGISSVSAAAGELLPGVENTTLSYCLST